MAKIINIYHNSSCLNFISPRSEFEEFYQSFLDSQLGRFHEAIPWKNLVRLFKNKTRRGSGRHGLFTLKGQLALMFLKPYTGYSDRKLIERLNTDYSFQFFCDVYIGPENRLTDYKIVSKIRCRLARHLDIGQFQEVLARYWGPHLELPNIVLMDATCYETNMRYPTHVKLLWECCEWVYRQLKKFNKVRKGRMPRSKYKEQKDKYLNYQKCKKKTHKLRYRRTRSLLYLLDKLIDQSEEMISGLPGHIQAPAAYCRRMEIIKEVFIQQKYWHENGQKPDNVIVSIAKSYIRPIVRGKEVKRVEFGAKANIIQAGGINFIEHLSYDAFHEGIRLKSCVQTAQKLTNTKCTHLGADRIYGTNVNRSYCKRKNITHSFVRKGKAGKYESQRKQISSILSKERSTRMEGSFGTEKNHYGLRRIDARTQLTETLWIVFGIHTANAVRMSKKMNTSKAPPGKQVA